MDGETDGEQELFIHLCLQEDVQINIFVSVSG